LLDGAEPSAFGFLWHPINRHGRKLGDLTNCAWSYRLQRNTRFALISVECTAGEGVEVLKDGRRLAGTLTTLPFI
jgi:aminomethyltransferase